LFIPVPAFRPEPIILQPFVSSVYQAVAQNGGAGAATRLARRAAGANCAGRAMMESGRWPGEASE
jgi:hypothetical protein